MRKAIICGTTTELTASDLTWLEELISISGIDEIFVITGEAVTAQITAWAASIEASSTLYATYKEALGNLGAQGFIVCFVENGVFSNLFSESEGPFGDSDIPQDAVVYFRNSPEDA
jgi:hypothetical protein